MEKCFEGKRILVTGGCTGIGRGTVLELWRCGANIVALSDQMDSLNQLKTEYPSVEIACVDLGNWQDTRELVDSLGVFYGLVNCAGIIKNESFLECKPTSFDDTMTVNAKAILNVSQVVAKKMIENGIKGSIVNISSQTSKAGFKDHLSYSASKGALDAMTRVMAVELGPYGIRVNTVDPTVVLTDLGRRAWSDAEKSASMLSKIPLGRFFGTKACERGAGKRTFRTEKALCPINSTLSDTPSVCLSPTQTRFCEVSEVVNAIVFLLSENASMINGTHLPIDGGFLAT